MANLKIAVYAIARDEQKFVERFMKSCQEADVIVVGVDHGDTTGDLLTAAGAQCYDVSLPDGFRFDAYRNEVLAVIPKDVDVCVSLDLDEVLEPGWREAIERAWVPGVTRLHYKLQWSEDRSFQYDRIHARHGYIWRHANHEAVYAIDRSKENIANCDLVVSHYPEKKAGRAKNLQLLELSVQEEPNSARMRWYLAREYTYEEKPGMCIKHMAEYFRLNSVWQAERCWAAIFAGRSYVKLGYEIDGLAWFHFAVRCCPNLRDPYFELAWYHFYRYDYEAALAEIRSALSIAKNKHNFCESNYAYTEQIYILEARCLIGLGKGELAKGSLMRAKRVNPDSQEVDVLLSTL